jgi:hypothetical protein
MNPTSFEFLATCLFVQGVIHTFMIKSFRQPGYTQSSGFSILQQEFGPEGISPMGLFKAAAIPTIVAMMCLCCRQCNRWSRLPAWEQRLHNLAVAQLF